MNTKIIIVGGVAGGMSAAARARRLSENSEIIVFEKGPHVSFANCGLPYYVGGEIAEEQSLLVQKPDTLRATHNLDVRVRHEVIAINREAQEVTVRRLDDDSTFIESYDALVLATGAKPLLPPIPGINRPGHFVVRNVPDAAQISQWIEDHNAQRAVIVGGGYIGLEMAEQLRLRGLEVSVAEALPQVMAPLDSEMAAWLHEELLKHGVALHLGDGVAHFDENPGGASTVVLQSGARLDADIVILGLGVRPEVELAKNAGLELGERGGLKVNEHLQTSDAHIWAVGDAIEVRDPVTGTYGMIPLAGPANRQGRIAADNICGRASVYKGTFGTAALRLFDLTAACTGANEKSLRRAGMEYEALHLHSNSHAGYYPGAALMAMKVLFSPSNGRLLGAQIIGSDGVDKRIDVLATALQAGLTVDDLAELELAYAPPLGSAKDPVNIAGMAAQNVLRGELKLVQWHEINELTAGEQGALLLDVRGEEELRLGKIPGARHIPLPQLRERLHELPQEKPIIVSCKSGQRAYYAYRILTQHGFAARVLSGSYRTWEKATKSATT